MGGDLRAALCGAASRSRIRRRDRRRPGRRLHRGCARHRSPSRTGSRGSGGRPSRERWPKPETERTRQDGILIYAYGRRAGAEPYAQGYPAHLHIDLLPELQGQGWGRRPRDAEAALRERGVTGLHLVASTGNTGALAFYPRLGFTAAGGGAGVRDAPLRSRSPSPHPDRTVGVADDPFIAPHHAIRGPAVSLVERGSSARCPRAPTAVRSRTPPTEAPAPPPPSAGAPTPASTSGRAARRSRQLAGALFIGDARWASHSPPDRLVVHFGHELARRAGRTVDPRPAPPSPRTRHLPPVSPASRPPRSRHGSPGLRLAVRRPPPAALRPSAFPHSRAGWRQLRSVVQRAAWRVE